MKNELLRLCFFRRRRSRSIILFGLKIRRPLLSHRSLSPPSPLLSPPPPPTHPPHKKKPLKTEDGVLHLHLTKADPGEPWAAAFAGHEKQQAGGAQGSSPAEDDAGRLLLERFQQEHPGLDFSGARLSGPAPDPRTFLKDLEEQERS